MGCSDSKPEKNRIEPHKKSDDVVGKSPPESVDGFSSEIPIYRTKIEPEDKKVQGGLIIRYTFINWRSDI